MGDAMYGKCDCCGKDSGLKRKYYYYDVVCDCCSGDTHFHIVNHCRDCEPKPPCRINIVLEENKPVERDR